MIRDSPRAVHGRLLLADGLVSGTLGIEGGRIVAIQRHDGHAGATVEAGIVAPGFIDLQVNGGFGVEIFDTSSLRHLAGRLPQTGVTGFLPTVVSSPAAVYPAIAAAVRDVGATAGARVLGLHLEGPLLSERRAGAHQRDVVRGSDMSGFEAALETDVVRLVTLAPERADAGEWIQRLRARDVVVSLGHTDATYEEVEAAADAGATMVTHLYNAMSPFAHRAPGAVGAALVDDRLTAGLIADGIHSHFAAVRLAIRAKGWERVALVTDMMAATGMPAGDFTLGGKTVRSDGRAARLPDGTLAGAILTMDEAVRNVIHRAGIPLDRALRMASEVPARLLGLRNAGRIALGNPADLVLLDDDLNVQGTLIDGKWAHCAGG